MGEPARKIEPSNEIQPSNEIPVSEAFVTFAHEHAAATGQPVGELLGNRWLRSFAALVDSATPEEIARDREQHELRQRLYGGSLEAEQRAWRDGTHPLHPTNRPKA